MNATEHWAVTDPPGDGDLTIYEMIDGEPVIVAYVGNPDADALQPGERGYRRLLARARLIAAAPDLLDALQAFMAPFDGLEVDHFSAFPNVTERIIAARAAIAKAAGQQ